MNQQQSEHRVGERASNGQRTSTEQANLDPTSYNAAPGTRAGRIAGEHCQSHVGPWEPASSPTSSRHLVSVMSGASVAKRRRRGDDGGTWLGDLLGASVDVAHGASEVCFFLCFHVWDGLEKLIFMFLCFYVYLLGIYFLGIYFLGISFLGNFFLRAYTALIPPQFLSY